MARRGACGLTHGTHDILAHNEESLAQVFHVVLHLLALLKGIEFLFEGLSVGLSLCGC